MKRYIIPLMMSLLVVSCGSKAPDTPKTPDTPVVKPDPAPLSVVTITAPAGSALAGKETLSADEAATYMTELQGAWKAAVKAAYEESFNAGKLIIGKDTMRVWWTTYGTKPADGRSLFISLHGGGGAPASLNNSQWENQKKLYQPANSVRRSGQPEQQPVGEPEKAVSARQFRIPLPPRHPGHLGPSFRQ